MIFSAQQLKIADFGAFKKSCGYNPAQPRSYVAKKEFVGQHFYIPTSFFSTFLIILFALSKIASSRSLLYKLSISFKPNTCILFLEILISSAMANSFLESILPRKHARFMNFLHWI